MKNRKSARILTFSFLFLTGSFLLPTNDSIPEVQGQSASPNLIDSAWKSPEISFETSDGPGVSQSFALFDKDGKLTYKALSIEVSQIKAIPNFYEPMFNPFTEDPNKWKLTVTPLLYATSEAVGKYSMDGRSLHIDFPGWSVTATVNNDEITGTFTVTASNQKGTWVMKRIPVKR